VAWKKARAREAWKKAKARKAWKKEKAREAWNKACIRNGSKRRLMLGLIEGCKRVEEGVPGGPGKRGGGLTQQSRTDEICLKVARGLKKSHLKCPSQAPKGTGPGCSLKKMFCKLRGPWPSRRKPGL
jgi:hypothetical protein